MYRRDDNVTKTIYPKQPKHFVKLGRKKIERLFRVKAKSIFTYQKLLKNIKVKCLISLVLVIKLQCCQVWISTFQSIHTDQNGVLGRVVTRKDLKKSFKKYWNKLHLQIIWYGENIVKQEIVTE